MLRSALLVALAAGCTNIVVAYAPLRPAPKQGSPRPAESVEVFTTPKIDHAYVEVGIIEVDGTTFEVVIQGLRSEAAKRGCDAVYVQGAGRSGYAGTCLVYTDAPPSTTPPTPPTAPTPAATPPTTPPAATP